MNKSDEYFIGLLQSGRIRVDAETGIVYSRNKPVAAKQSAGYLHMSAGPTRQERHYILLHRLVWMAVNGEIPGGLEINHKNGNKRDNRIDNLELLTHAGNALHAHRVLGTASGYSAGESNSRAKLTWEQVREIRRLWLNLHTQAEIAALFNMSHQSISNIVNNKSWHE